MVQLASFQSRLSVEIRTALARLGQPASFQVGDIVLTKESPGGSLYLIDEGEVEVSFERAPSRPAGTGDLVGVAGFLGSDERSTVVARTSLRARRIEARELADAFAPSPGNLHAVLDAIRSVHLEMTTAPNSADAYVQDLASESLSHRAVRHPYLDAIGRGDLPDLRWALRDFAQHYYGYSRTFPQYLTAVLSKLEVAEHRVALLENLTEESGQYAQEEIDELASLGIEQAWYDGVPHPVLFARFAKAMGAELNPDHEADQVVCWREMFLAILSSGSAAQAVGALGLGTENIVSTIYIPFVSALERLQVPGRDAVFFPLHTAVDDDHQEVLQRIAASFAHTQDGRRDLRRGMLKALQCRERVLGLAIRPSSGAPPCQMEFFDGGRQRHHHRVRCDCSIGRSCPVAQRVGDHGGSRRVRM